MARVHGRSTHLLWRIEYPPLMSLVDESAILEDAAATGDKNGWRQVLAVDFGPGIHHGLPRFLSRCFKYPPSGRVVCRASFRETNLRTVLGVDGEFERGEDGYAGDGWQVTSWRAVVWRYVDGSV